jgi:hypothetical protein
MDWEEGSGLEGWSCPEEEVGDRSGLEVGNQFGREEMEDEGGWIVQLLSLAAVDSVHKHLLYKNL